MPIICNRQAELIVYKLVFVVIFINLSRPCDACIRHSAMQPKYTFSYLNKSGRCQVIDWTSIDIFLIDP